VVCTEKRQPIIGGVIVVVMTMSKTTDRTGWTTDPVVTTDMTGWTTDPAVTTDMTGWTTDPAVTTDMTG